MVEKQVKHLAIILDGNRRFAKRLLLEPWRGHELGAEKIEKLFDWCAELEIKQVSLYCFSMENFDRPEKEKNFLMNLFKKEFRKYLGSEKIRENGIRIKFMGERQMFDEELQELMGKIEEETGENNKFLFNFCMAYGGRQEIVQACRNIVENKEEVSEENLRKNLWLEDEPELIIRTGGEIRTSNFLMFQSAYSEWIFLDKTWPEFDKSDLISCLEEFRNRERRFGK